VDQLLLTYGLFYKIVATSGYSGYTFSHYESLFPTRDFIPFVWSGLYQLVTCVKGIRVCALHCVRAVTSIHITLEVFGVDTTLSESRILYH